MNFEEKITEILDFVSYHFKLYLLGPVQKIIKIFQYIPVLWRDEDWDEEYLADLINYKLGRMYNCLDKNDLVVREELDKMLATINKARAHIYKWKNYDIVYEEQIEKSPVNISHRFEKLSNGSSELVSVNEDTGKDATEEEDKLYYAWLGRMHEFEHEQWCAIWDTIKENGRSWWD